MRTTEVPQHESLECGRDITKPELHHPEFKQSLMCAECRLLTIIRVDFYPLNKSRVINHLDYQVYHPRGEVDKHLSTLPSLPIQNRSGPAIFGTNATGDAHGLLEGCITSMSSKSFLASWSHNCSIHQTD